MDADGRISVGKIYPGRIKWFIKRILCLQSASCVLYARLNLSFALKQAHFLKQASHEQLIGTIFSALWPS